jgi:hypothetical protein
MKKLFFPLFLIAMAALPAFVSAQTADEIIGKYIDAIGGRDNLKKINTLRMEGDIEVQGLKIPFTAQGINGKGFRTDAEFNGNKIIDIITPTMGWSQNPMANKATLQPITEEELKQRLDQLDIQDPFLDYKDKGSIVEYIGKDEEDGNEYHKIKMVTKHQRESTYFFDLKTNLIYKTETLMKQDGQEFPMTSKNFDYQLTDVGVKMPFKVDQGGMIMATRKVVVNPAVDEKLFTAN